MDYRLVSKLIFQHFITTGVNVINSTPMLKALIIAYLTDNSIVYSNADVDSLVVEVMKFLSVEEVVTPAASNAVDVKRPLSRDELKKINAVIIDIKNKIKSLSCYKEPKTVKEVEAILDGNWDQYDEKGVDLLLKVSDYLGFIDDCIDEAKRLEE